MSFSWDPVLLARLLRVREPRRAACTPLPCGQPGGDGLSVSHEPRGEGPGRPRGGRHAGLGQEGVWLLWPVVGRPQILWGAGNVRAGRSPSPPSAGAGGQAWPRWGTGGERGDGSRCSSSPGHPEEQGGGLGEAVRRDEEPTCTASSAPDSSWPRLGHERHGTSWGKS